jgi:hypothetical protein
MFIVKQEYRGLASQELVLLKNVSIDCKRHDIDLSKSG